MIAVAIILTAFAAHNVAFGRHASNEELLSEKHGRVIDAQTGGGIAGVQVFGVWDVAWQNFHSGGFGCKLQKAVTTDPNGNYILPNVAKELDLSRRKNSSWWSVIVHNDYSSADYGWRVVVYKRGYLRKGDAEQFNLRPQLRTEGFSVGFPWEGGMNQDATFANGTVLVDPIELVEDTLDPIQRIAYFDRLRSALNCRVDPDSPAVAEVKRSVAREARELPCAMPPEQLIDGETALELADMVWDKAIWERFAAKGEPSMRPWKEITAGDACWAIHGDARP